MKMSKKKSPTLVKTYLIAPQGNVKGKIGQQRVQMRVIGQIAEERPIVSQGADENCPQQQAGFAITLALAPDQQHRENNFHHQDGYKKHRN